MDEQLNLLDVVVNLDDLPEARLALGQVGTAVARLDEATVMVEFSDDKRVAHVITPVPDARLLTLSFEPEPAPRQES